MNPRNLSTLVPTAMIALFAGSMAMADEMNPVDSAPPSDRIEMSVSDLQQLLRLPPGASLQEAPDAPKRLFKDMSEVERFLNKRPVICTVPDAPDPMIIPWVRERVVAESLLADATTAIAAKDYVKARETLKVICEMYPDTPSRPEAERQLGLMSGSPVGVGGIIDLAPPAMITLPDWVSDNLTGVVISEGNKPIALVGNDVLRVGDPVPRYPAVRVKSIAPSEVVFEYMDKEIQVEVVGAF